MTEQSIYSSASEWELLSDSAIVFRALLRKQWWDDVTGKIRFDAYLLSPNELGLSVNIATFCSPEKKSVLRDSKIVMEWLVLK